MVVNLLHTVRNSGYETKDLFGNTEIISSKRKHTTKHWSYYRRLIHLLHDYKVNGHAPIKWKRLYNLDSNYLRGLNDRYHANNWNVTNAIKEMHRYKCMTPEQRKASHETIRRIAHDFKLSLPTMYRAYHRKYGK